MVSGFYRRYSSTILCGVLLSLPLLIWQAETIPVDNTIERWLPGDAQVRVTYDRFRQLFGAEELVLVALPRDAAEPELLEALALRVERIPGVRHCWSPDRMRTAMSEFQVADEEITRRLTGLVRSADGKLVALLVPLSADGVKDRATTVAAIRQEVAYCQLPHEQVRMAGGPVVVAEIDRLSAHDANSLFEILTLVFSAMVLYWHCRQWKLTFALLGLTIWAIQLTMAGIAVGGGEMNFILCALPVMVMVFTLAMSIHLLHYVEAAEGDADPLGKALRLAWKPCVLATLTTAIGLASLSISEIAPVRAFGYWSVVGCVAALVTGLGLTPAVLVVCPPQHREANSSVPGMFARLADILVHRGNLVALGSVIVVVACGLGMQHLSAHIDTLDLLPTDSRVLEDVHVVERDLTKVSSIEAIVDLSDRDLPFFGKLDELRRIEAVIAAHPAVSKTVSLATFFPQRISGTASETAQVLKTAQSREGNNAYVAGSGDLLRISARINVHGEWTRQRIFADLQDRMTGEPVVFTGLTPLLDRAQISIFNGFWESFATAFLIITVVMVVSLRSLKIGVLAMIPNLTPIALVFGMLGWMRIPVDVGMMMTASIALGIAVDGTFHFLVRYEEARRVQSDRFKAVNRSLRQTGAPIFAAALVSSLGMMAMTFSQFTPMSRFGLMMATLLMAAVIGDLVVLPAVLSVRLRGNVPTPTPAPELVHHPTPSRSQRHSKTHSPPARQPAVGSVNE